MKKETQDVITKDQKSKMLLIAFAVAVFVIVCAIIFMQVNGSARKYEKQLELAQRYLEDMDYESAIIGFEQTISMDPKVEDGYLGLADTYVAMAEESDIDKSLQIEYYEKSLDVLNEGLSAVDNEDGIVLINSQIQTIEDILGEMYIESENNELSDTTNEGGEVAGATNEENVVLEIDPLILGTKWFGVTPSYDVRSWNVYICYEDGSGTYYTFNNEKYSIDSENGIAMTYGNLLGNYISGYKPLEDYIETYNFTYNETSDVFTITFEDGSLNEMKNDFVSVDEKNHVLMMKLSELESTYETIPAPDPYDEYLDYFEERQINIELDKEINYIWCNWSTTGFEASTQIFNITEDGKMLMGSGFLYDYGDFIEYEEYMYDMELMLEMQEDGMISVGSDYIICGWTENVMVVCNHNYDHIYYYYNFAFIEDEIIE